MAGPVSDTTTDPLGRHRRADGWRTGRIWISGALGVWLAGSRWALDFWPLSAGLGQTLRTLTDLSAVLLVLPLAGFIVGLSIAAGIALWRHQLRRAASSGLALAALPICIVVVAKVPLFDPWLWYALANATRFEAIAGSGPANGPKYAVLDEEDVSTGFSGIDPNHFVLLIYDESDAVGRQPSERPSIWQTRRIDGLGSPIPKGRRLTGHVFRVDVFE